MPLLYPIPRILPLTVNLLIAIFSVLTGLAFGSFLNVCISRLPQHESVVRPRSRCPRCHHPIRERDNIPVLSWLVLRGRCRDCGTRIPIRYPLIEFATAALFLLCFLRFGVSMKALGAATICWLLLGLAAADAESFLLPDAMTLPGIALGMIFTGVNTCCGLAAQLRAAGTSLLAAAVGAAVILLIRWLYWLVRRREGIGLGDAKLLAMNAAWLGPWLTLLTLFLAVIAGAIYGVGLLIAHRLGAGRGHASTTEVPRLPLGSFLCGAGIFAIFCGRPVIDWYLSLMRY
jgi:leader peptidase (prepilin peptidase) / N-methyltransferase